MPWTPIKLSCKRCGRPFLGNRPDREFCSRLCAVRDRQIPVTDRFWAQVKKTKTCWLWTGALNSDGRGRLSDKGVRTTAHRFSYELHISKPPADMEVCHHCDVGHCVRPDHLYLGKHIENMRDIVMRKTKITALQNRCNLRGPALGAEIKKLRATGMSQQSIADKLGIGQISVSRILRGKARNY